jgi:GNAT superfamily N-acetyltransferase
MHEAVADVLPLSPATLSDFLKFFDGTAFSDNPRWSSCYCQCFYEDHSKVVWPDRTAAQNRARACERATTGEMQGYLAYVDGQPVGWCSAAPRHLFHVLDNEPTPDAEHVGAILCFLVSPENRGKGIARRLLGAACDGFRAQGVKIAEANPRPSATSPADNHFGPLSLFLSEGFQIHRPDTDGSVFVRKLL